MLTYDRRVTLLALAAGLPGIVVALLLLGVGGYSWLVRATAAVLLIGLWLATTLVLRDRIIRPLQTLSNLLAALREDDFSIRARGAATDGAPRHRQGWTGLFRGSVASDPLRGPAHP